MSPERCGGLPTGALIRLCYSGKFSEKEMLKKATGAGGFNAYLGTNDAREVMKKIDAGDEKARLIMDAFIYQVCKDIGAQATVLKGKVDQIIITGGIAYNDRITSAMKERIGFIAPVTVYPGEDELLALAQGAIRVMNGEEKAKVY
jgi:butyrate kinase